MSEHDYADDSTDPAMVASATTTATVTDSAQPWSYDSDGDGQVDVVQWTFGDGTWQELRDVDGDGSADVLLVDTDGDDVADFQIWDNGDGTYTVAQDADGDGEFETEQTFSREELDADLPGVPDLLASQLDDGTGSAAGPQSTDATDSTDSTDGTQSDSTPDPNAPGSAAGGDTTDGTAPTAYDSDGDGVVDAVEWDFGDGTWQVLADVDADGDADVLLIDTDGDDTADFQIWDNGDGSYTVLQDADGDGVFESEDSFTRQELDQSLPGVADLLDSQVDGAATGTGAGDTTGAVAAPTGDPDAAGPATADGAVLLDYDSDGVADTLQWNFGDGTWQELRDVDGDGNADVLVIDTDGDDVANYAISDNGDGTYTVYADSDNDGQWDDQGQTFTREELNDSLPGIPELLDTQIEGPVDGGDDPDIDGAATGDGAVLIDYDADGAADTLHWDFGDGTWQELRDVDGDNQADVLLIDTDADDVANYAIAENGDGTYTIYADSDNDGQWDDDGRVFTRAELDDALPGVSDVLDGQIDPGAGSGEPGQSGQSDEPPQPAEPTQPSDIGGGAGDVQVGDLDENGQTDVIQWSYPDGTWQQLIDVDGNGTADVLVIDVNGDDQPDIQIWSNRDGTYTAAQDTDGDGEFETEQTFTADELDAALPGVTDLLDSPMDSIAAGTPAADTPDQPAEPADPAAATALTGTATAGDADGNPVTKTDWSAVDTDGDGVVDVEGWSFPDGTWQVLVDRDGNASADVLAIDTDGDDTENIQVYANGDGTYTVHVDADGDGTFEVQSVFDRAELDARLPGAADLLDTTYQTPSGPPAPPQDQTAGV